MPARPIIKWLIFGACLGLFALAMAWVTQRMMRMEDARRKTEIDSQLQERMRLALWRMDSLMNALLIRENARSADQFLPFHSPAVLYLNRSQAVVPQGEAVVPSPLLGEPPEFVLLHFEVIGSRCTSPQVPSGSDLSLASNWYSVAHLDAARQRLAQLQQMIDAKPAALGGVPIKSMFDKARNDQTSTPAPASPGQALANAQDLQKRAATLQNAAANAASPAAPAPRDEASFRLPSPPQSGDLRPVWLKDHLLFVRDAQLDNIHRIQGVWLDWPTLRGRLTSSVSDLLPYARLEPTMTRLEDASSLVSLPARLLPGPLPPLQVESFPLARMMLIAWTCFVVAAIGAGLVLHRATVLSERRGAFVSAVTHELRTPLTTFQLYSEMLADDMVPDPEQRREYLRTLASESSRLSHLVENVLGWSRIERGRASARIEQLNAATLIQRCESRLRQRTSQAGLDLEIVLPDHTANIVVVTDASAVEQILFNLVDNACKYAGSQSDPRVVRVAAIEDSLSLYIYVIDFGPGLSGAQLKRLFRPFEKSASDAAHSAPGVGLGLAFSRRLALELKGNLEWHPGDQGASFVLTLPRPPVDA